MIAGVNKPGVEVSMPHPRTARRNVLFVFLALVAFLISGIVTASPKPGTQQGHLIPPDPAQVYPVTVEVLSSLPEGVNCVPYVHKLYVSIRHNLFVNLPESATSGEHGVVVVRLHIQKDGSLPDKFVTIVSSSGKTDMDYAALSAIRTAAPFGRLPEAFLVPNLDLMFTFYFRSTPPPPKPKIVPVRIAANHIRESITTERP
jgi:TonB family protein